MELATKPANIDALTEIGRTLTTETLYIHFANGLLCMMNRGNTCSTWHQLDEITTREITDQYSRRGRWINWEDPSDRHN